MVIVKKAVPLLFGLSLLCGADAIAQPAPGGPGPGPGMMSRGPGPGMGMKRGAGPWSEYRDPAAYLDGLKGELGITAAQEPAWTAYATTVTSTAEQMRAAHRTIWEAMATATWQERRDMMNNMFRSKTQAFDTVHTAAEQLLPALTPSQRARAQERLPGLVFAPRGMRGPWAGRGPRVAPPGVDGTAPPPAGR